MNLASFCLRLYCWDGCQRPAAGILRRMLLCIHLNSAQEMICHCSYGLVCWKVWVQWRKVLLCHWLGEAWNSTGIKIFISSRGWWIGKIISCIFQSRSSGAKWSCFRSKLEEDWCIPYCSLPRSSATVCPFLQTAYCPDCLFSRSGFAPMNHYQLGFRRRGTTMLSRNSFAPHESFIIR